MIVMIYLVTNASFSNKHNLVQIWPIDTPHPQYCFAQVGDVCTTVNVQLHEEFDLITTADWRHDTTAAIAAPVSDWKALLHELAPTSTSALTLT